MTQTFIRTTSKCIIHIKQILWSKFSFSHTLPESLWGSFTPAEVHGAADVSERGQSFLSKVKLYSGNFILKTLHLISTHWLVQKRQRRLWSEDWQWWKGSGYIGVMKINIYIWRNLVMRCHNFRVWSTSLFGIAHLKKNTICPWKRHLSDGLRCFSWYYLFPEQHMKETER